MTQHPVTTAEAAEKLGIPTRIIKSWKDRKRIMPIKTIAGRGRGGMVDVYDLHELQPIAEGYRQRLAKPSTRQSDSR